MPNIGMPEMLLILVAALIIFGPKKLPELGRSLGHGIREFRKGTQGLKDDLESSFREEAAPTAPSVTSAEAAQTIHAQTVEAAPPAVIVTQAAPVQLDKPTQNREPHQA